MTIVTHAVTLRGLRACERPPAIGRYRVARGGAAQAGGKISRTVPLVGNGYIVTFSLTRLRPADATKHGTNGHGPGSKTCAAPR